MAVVEPCAKRIGDKLWVGFDEHIDLRRLESLELELITGIAKARQYIEPLTVGSRNCQFDKSICETLVWMLENPDDPELKQLQEQGATFHEQYDFVRYRHKTAVFGEKLMLRAYENYAGGFARKHIARLNKDREAYKFFPGLRSFIDDSGIFKEVGRVIIFLTPPGSGVPIHSDYADGQTRRDQFLWLNIKGQKSFFILDENLQKDYITASSAVFDNTTWHGGDPNPGSSFTVRVDGLFTDEWMHRTGIYEHFARPRGTK